MVFLRRSTNVEKRVYLAGFKFKINPIFKEDPNLRTDWNLNLRVDPDHAAGPELGSFPRRPVGFSLRPALSVVSFDSPAFGNHF